MTLLLIDEALAEGVPLEAACERLGVSVRTVQRWRKPAGAEDRRCGPRTQPANRLTDVERRRVLALANSEEYRDVSPKQIVPRLADRGEYVASEASFYRVLREAKQLAHRGRARPATSRPRAEHVASAPNQVWTWDITYLRGPVRGSFLYLYLVVDIFSRRIMGWQVHEEECNEKAAALMRRSWQEAGCPAGLVLHSDNGGPMKGATLLATLQALGVAPSFSRPRVSDDNPFSEALFRTLKYVPAFPEGPFASLEAAGTWVDTFVRWYNTQHRHSAIRFVTPDERHSGREDALLQQRHAVYQRARRRHPERWTGATRNWTPAGPVRLGPEAATPSPSHSFAVGPPPSPSAGGGTTAQPLHPILATGAPRGGAAGGVPALSAGATHASDERGAPPPKASTRRNLGGTTPHVTAATLKATGPMMRSA